MKKLLLFAAAGATLLPFATANAALATRPDANTLALQEVQAKAFQSYETSRKAFSEFRGDYLLENGAILRLTRHGRHFFAEVTGQPQIEIRATSPDTFVAIAGGSELVFEQHANGIVSRVLWKQSVKG